MSFDFLTYNLEHIVSNVLRLHVHFVRQFYFNIKYLISAGILKSLMTVIFNNLMLLYIVHYNNFKSAEKCVFTFFENDGEQVKTVEGKHTVLISYLFFYEYFNVNETFIFKCVSNVKPN